jgi:hypothetical protein
MLDGDTATHRAPSNDHFVDDFKLAMRLGH